MNKSVSQNTGLVPSSLRGLIASAAAALGIAAVCAFAALSMPDPSRYAVIFASASLFIGAFAGGFAAARRHGGATLACGALTAAFMLALISLLALVFSVKMNVSAFALRALGVLVCSVLGANVGVGTHAGGKKKKKRAHGRR